MNNDQLSEKPLPVRRLLFIAHCVIVKIRHSSGDKFCPVRSGCDKFHQIDSGKMKNLEADLNDVEKARDVKKGSKKQENPTNCVGFLNGMLILEERSVGQLT